MSLHSLYHPIPWLSLTPEPLQRLGVNFLSYGNTLFQKLQPLFSQRVKTWNWLSSAERQREYIMSIPEQDLTQQDFADLKGTDF